eukprot:6868971-Pyramimonas_sp.AAC.1
MSDSRDPDAGNDIRARLNLLPKCKWHLNCQPDIDLGCGRSLPVIEFASNCFERWATCKACFKPDQNTDIKHGQSRDGHTPTSVSESSDAKADCDEGCECEKRDDELCELSDIKDDTLPSTFDAVCQPSGGEAHECVGTDGGRSCDATLSTSPPWQPGDLESAD